MVNKIPEIENIKKELLEKVDNLSPTELSRLCVDVIRKILNRSPVDNTIKNSFEKSKETLVDLMIEHNIEIYYDKKGNERK